MIKYSYKFIEIPKPVSLDNYSFLKLILGFLGHSGHTEEYYHLFNMY